MADVLNLLEKTGLKKLRAAIRQTLVGRGGRGPVTRLETVVKTGTPEVLKKEYRAYSRLLHYLKKEERQILFPEIAFDIISPRRALLAVQPVGDNTLEEVILGIIGAAEKEGWRSKAVQMRQRFITHLTKRVLKKLAILHRPIQIGNPQRELYLFTQELTRGLAESLRNAGIQWNTALLKSRERREKGVVSLAHRDLGLPNMVVNENNDVFLIDPRGHVVSASANRQGARFASPIIDLAALLVGFQRSELEIGYRRVRFRLSAKRCVQQEIAKMLRNKKVTPFLFHLSEAVVWAGYAACQCSLCRDPQRAWLRDESVSRVMRCLSKLSRLR